jgi:glycosyltransferase involved in cell wall biosynthesis
VTPATNPYLTAVVVAAYDDVPLARATVRTVLAELQVSCIVIDVDGCYMPVADEQVVPIGAAVAALELGIEAMTAAATLSPDDFTFYAGVLGASYAIAQGAVGAAVVGTGVLVLDDLRTVLDEVSGALVVPYTDATSVVRRAAVASVHVRRDWDTGLLSFEGSGAGALFSRALFLVRSQEHGDLLRRLAADWRVSEAALDTFAIAVDATVSTGASLLIGPWRDIGATDVDAHGRLRVDGERVRAVDLTDFDAHRPWTLDAGALINPRVLLSEHPALARLTAAEAEARVADEAALELADPQLLGEGVKPARVRFDTMLRTEARRAERSRGVLPDLLGLGMGPDRETWALGLVPEGDPLPVARYLAAVRHARMDLQHVFRAVPGGDAAGLARWALRHGASEGLVDPDLLLRAAELTLAAQLEASAAAKGPRAPGVNLVGYLAGELGLGESARLVDEALQSAGVETSTYDVSRDLESRRGAKFRRSEAIMRATSLICVNGAETAHVVPQLKTLLKRTRVIGMWYWELEDFPKAHQAGFDYVDEVWAATDFIRDAIAKHAGDTPVRTVTPPLPQAGDDPGVVPERFGIPEDRPWFLFTFDFLSLATRKNPYGLVEAFSRAFEDLPSGERPLLVIKTINADRYPGHAERLRFQIAGREDILFLDAYLDNHERHVLVSHCTAYVSLHKAEGLGLTVAEAMAWDKPVITTAYGGVMQFCTPENAFLVDWKRGYVEEAAGPYEKGLPWAEPDLDQAAACMRAVVDDPERAAAVGAQAGKDIRELHNAHVAGIRMRAALEEGDALWHARRAGARAARQAERRQRREDEVALTAATLPTPTPAARARRLARAGRAQLRRRVQAIYRRS